MTIEDRATVNNMIQLNLLADKTKDILIRLDNMLHHLAEINIILKFKNEGDSK